MLYTKLAYALAFTAAGVLANPSPVAQNNNAALTLDPKAVQSGSFADGTGAIGAEATQAKSLTSQNNFINFCAGKTLTNGLQFTQGSCNGIPMGDIPAKTKMTSSIIIFPEQNGTPIQSDTTFDIQVQVANLVAGSFTNADATYYSAPQQLQGGVVVGHTHVTVQDLGNSLNPKQPLDATQFAFFKGINDAGNGQGLLKATVTGGLPAGNYRVCTLASASNHQLVLMPVAQRGSADDCTKFTVVGNGQVANNAANNQAGGVNAAKTAQDAINAAKGAANNGAQAAQGAQATQGAQAAQGAKGAQNANANKAQNGQAAQAQNANANNAQKGQAAQSAQGAQATQGAKAAQATQGAQGGKAKLRFARRQFIA